MPTDQPIGVPLPGWTPRPRPPRTNAEGRFCRLEPLDPARHGPDLAAANATDTTGRMWTYLGYGPFADDGAYAAWLAAQAVLDDPLFYAIVTPEHGAAGLASYLRIEPAAGVIEIGHLAFSPRLQRTPAATEALFLLLRRAFDELGYRRVEWKCDSLNAPSARAAERLGFTYEGLFRQATVTKGRNRDTAWYSIIDGEWPAIRAGFESWLAPDTFDGAGTQRRPLQAMRSP